MWKHLKVGDRVWRNLAGINMLMEVTDIFEDGIIECGAIHDGELFRGGWTFDPETGAEIDDFLKWGPPPMMTGSYLEKRVVS